MAERGRTVTTEKKFIDAQELMEDSIRLGIRVLQSGFRPNFIVGVWRGGTPVGIVVQELLDFYGVKTDHIAIRTSSYSAFGKRESQVRVHGLSYLIKNINAEDTLLIVDDVYDTGLSTEAIIANLQMKARRNTPNIRIATVYFKPENNKTERIPDYYVHETDRWLVFPHELDGLTLDEIYQYKPGLKEILSQVNMEPE
jgi:hypoxanthine phosphoribosyltransferase